MAYARSQSAPTMAGMSPSPPVRRRIAHLDMDAFYASVTLLRYPQLEGLPMVIGGARLEPEALLEHCRRAGADPAIGMDELHRMPAAFFPRLRHYRGRGVITTASYAARQHGLRSAMSLSKASRLYPDAILLPTDFDEYRRYSRAFKKIILSMAPVMEDRGIDEVYIDFGAAPDGLLQEGYVLAQRLQQAITEGTGLGCSIGVAPNKLLAKMASEFDKPKGITILLEHELESRIWPLPCNRINGIGPKTWQRLQALGVETIGDLAACSTPWLMAHFGSRQGNWLHQSAHGIDERPPVTHSEPVSISRETTFERDLHAVHDRATLGGIFSALAERVAGDLQRKGYAGRTIGIKLRYADFRIATRDLTLDLPTQDARRIREAAGQCLKRVDLRQRLRLLGIRVSSLQPVGQAMPPLPMAEEGDAQRDEAPDTAPPSGQPAAGAPARRSASDESARTPRQLRLHF